jgi:hypothetical protein
MSESMVAPGVVVRRFWPALVAVMLLAAGLRFAGIGHGLDTGFIAHPDTSKQVDAIERFLNGERYWKIGYSDYDGYPLFASRLTALIIQAGTAVVNPVRGWLGREEWPAVPEKLDRFHAMRCVNATLAVFAVLVAGWGGRVLFSPGAGLLGALLLALSPADVAAGHYASGDTAAAAFGLLAFVLAARLARDGRRVDALLTGFFAALAFASKYHALVAFAAAGLAVLVYAGVQRQIPGRAMLVHAALVAAGGLAGLLFAIPGLREEPVAMVADIRAFIRYAANFGLPEALADAGFFGKLFYSLRHNLPVLVGLLSLPVVVALPWGLVRMRREPWIAVLLAGPLLYFVMGVSLRPAAHPVYHTLLTGPVLLVAAAGMVRLPRWSGVSLAALSAAWLGHGAYREVFYFTRPDLRTVMQGWMQENVPAAYGYYQHRYAFASAMHTGVAWSAHGTVRVSPSLRPLGTSEHFAPWFTAVVERDALPVFRNPAIDFQLRLHSSVDPAFILPVDQRIPSEATAPWILVDLPEFYRSGRMGVVQPGRTTRRAMVSVQPLRDLAVTVTAGGDPGRVTVVLGGRRVSTNLAAHASATLPFSRLLSRAPWGTGVHLYNLAVRARGGAVRWSVGFTDDPSSSASRATGFASPLHAEDPLFPRFGIAARYLNDLPYLAWTAEGGAAWSSGPQWLEPGWYRMRITLDRAVEEKMSVRVAFTDGRRRSAREVVIAPIDGRTLVVEHLLGDGLRGGQIDVVLTADQAGIAGVELHPDPVLHVWHHDRLEKQKEANDEAHSIR